MDDNDDKLYPFSLFYWQINLSYLPYGILGVFRIRAFLRRHVYYGKILFFYFLQGTHYSVKLHVLVYVMLDSSNLRFRRLECGLGRC